MDEILFCGEKVLLKTSLTEESFAKTKFSRFLDESGFLVTKAKNGTFVFSPWKFTGTKSNAEDDVFFEGESFYGKTISSVLSKANSGDKDSSEEARKVLFLLVSIYNYAIEKEINLPCLGVFGIAYDSENERFLFVSEKTFDRCAANLGKKDYSIMQESWRDSALSGKNALNFTRAVFAYFALTKNLPYPAANTDKSVDISYKNFLPLEYAVNGINKNLAFFINDSLSGKLPKTRFPLSQFEEELFHPERRKKILSKANFEKEKKLFTSRQKRKFSNRQKFNKAKGILAFSIVSFAIVFVFAFILISENRKKPTTIGLDSTETTEVFYKGIHQMDTDFMLATAKNCPEAQGYISRIPQIYVTANMKSAFNFESGVSTPENWFFFEPDSSRAYSHFIYGISNFTIDGNPSTLNLKVPTLKNHKKRLLKENGERLDNFSKAEHKVHYWLVHNVDENIQIEECTTLVSLRWFKNRWQISFLEEVKDIQTISEAAFSKEYKMAFLENGEDYIKTADALREKYNWIPTRKSLEEEKTYLAGIGYFF